MWRARRTPKGVCPSMKGTSGAAERSLLRGRAREAALKARCLQRAGRRVNGGHLTRVPSRERGSPTRIQHARRQGVSGPNGLGRSRPRERSRWRASTARRRRVSRSLTRDISAGCAPEGASPSAICSAGREAALQATGCADGLPSAVSSGVRAVHGRARSSHRWQKSTGGVRPVVPRREERPGPTRGSSPLRAQQPGGRKSVGSRIAGAKPRDRWRV